MVMNYMMFFKVTVGIGCEPDTEEGHLLGEIK
jgi:hypothetical protein